MTVINFGTIFAFAINAILIENIVLNQLMGCTPFISASQKSETAFGMGVAVTVIMAVTSMATHGIYYLILEPLKLEYLWMISFVLVISALVQLVQMFLKRFTPRFYKLYGSYLPLITSNCAVLGICLTNVQNGYNFLTSFLNSIFSAIGFTLAIWIFSLIRARLEESCDIPKAFQGFPIALIAAALLAFGFMGFNGLTL